MRKQRILALTVVLAGVLAGCGDSPTGKKAAEETKEAIDAAARAAKAAGEKVRTGAEKAVDVVESGAKVAGEKIEAGAEDAAAAIRHGAEKVEDGARDAVAKGKAEMREIKESIDAKADAAKIEAERNAAEAEKK